MIEIKYLVWIWKRSFLGFYYKAPVVRTAHTNRRRAKRLKRAFSFEYLMRPRSCVRAGTMLKEASA